MKAVVLEVRDGVAAVLRDDGVVEKLRRDCRVGETIELGDRGKVVRFPGRASRWAAAAAAALIVMTAGGTYGYNNAYAYSYVTLDGAASVEYVLNRRDRVIRVNALNEDGESLAAELNAAGVKNASLEDAMALTSELLSEGDYLDDGEAFSVSVRSRGEDRERSLAEDLDAYFAEADNDPVFYVAGGPGQSPRGEERPGEMLLDGEGENGSVTGRQEPAPSPAANSVPQENPAQPGGDRTRPEAESRAEQEVPAQTPASAAGESRPTSAAGASTSGRSNQTAQPTSAPAVVPTGTPVPIATAMPTPTAEPTATPAPTAEPTATPEPTVEPTATPAPTAEPTATPEPTAVPTATPAPTAEPTATPEPTAKPTATPEPTAEPTATPAPTAEPTATPAPTAEPTAMPAPTAEPTAMPGPGDQPGASGEPEAPEPPSQTGEPETPGPGDQPGASGEPEAPEPPSQTGGPETPGPGDQPDASGGPEPSALPEDQQGQTELPSGDERQQGPGNTDPPAGSPSGEPV